MSDEPADLPPDQPPAFAEYEVEGIGTVIAPEGEPGYRVRLHDGRVTAYPAASGAPSEANAAADIAWAIANPVVIVDQAAIYAEQLAPGYLDVPTGIRLKTVETAQARLAQMVTLVNLARALGAMTDDSTVTLWDFDNAEQSMTVAQFRALMLRYGLACKQLFDDYAP